MLKPIFVSAISLFIATSAAADTVVTFSSTGDQDINKILIHAGNVKMPAPSSNMRLVMDTNKQRMLMIDDGKKQYMEMNTDTIKQTASMMDTVRQQMMAQLENMPEEQRKMLEQRMGINLQKAPATPKISVKATGKKKTVSEIKCEIHDVLSDGKKTMQACVAEVKASGVLPEDYKTMKKMFQMSRDFAKEANKMGGPAAANTIANMPELNGVPMEVKNLETGDSITITSIDTKTKLKDSDFQAASNYKKINPLEQMQQMGGTPGLSK